MVLLSPRTPSEIKRKLRSWEARVLDGEITPQETQDLRFMYQSFVVGASATRGFLPPQNAPGGRPSKRRSSPWVLGQQRDDPAPTQRKKASATMKEKEWSQTICCPK